MEVVRHQTRSLQNFHRNSCMIFATQLKLCDNGSHFEIFLAALVCRFIKLPNLKRQNCDSL